MEKREDIAIQVRETYELVIDCFYYRYLELPLGLVLIECKAAVPK